MIRLLALQLRASKQAIPAIIIMVTLTQLTYGTFQAWLPDPQPDYTIELMPTVQHCKIIQYPMVVNSILVNGKPVTLDTFSKARDPLKWWLNCVSYHLFDTPKLIPIFFNVVVLPLVYLISNVLMKDRLLALVAFAAFAINPLYAQWQTSGTYDQVWSFFLLLVIWFTLRHNYLFIPSFIGSLLSKFLIVGYLPSFWYLNHKYWKRFTKEENVILMACVGCAIFALVTVGHDKLAFMIGSSGIGFYPDNIHDAIFRNFEMLWPEVPALAIFTALAVNFRPKNPSGLKKLCGVWMLNGLAITPIIFLFTTQAQFVYRFVPFALFMSIFVAVTLNELIQCIIELRLAKIQRLKKTSEKEHQP